MLLVGGNLREDVVFASIEHGGRYVTIQYLLPYKIFIFIKVRKPCFSYFVRFYEPVQISNRKNTDTKLRNLFIILHKYSLRFVFILEGYLILYCAWLFGRSKLPATALIQIESFIFKNVNLDDIV